MHRITKKNKKNEKSGRNKKRFNLKNIETMKKKRTDIQLQNINKKKDGQNIEEDSEDDFDTQIEDAQTLLIQTEYDKAKDSANRALEIATKKEDKCYAQDLLGQILNDIGDTEKAIISFKESEELIPRSSFERLLTLGQLHEGKESLKYYQYGQQVLQELLQGTSKNNSTFKKQKEYRKEIMLTASNVLCSIGDLYLTDLCDEPDAEKQCEYFFTEAIDICDTNCEAYRAMANFRLIQGRTNQAKKIILDSYKLLLENFQDTTIEPPSFFSRVEIAKILYEQKLWKQAAELYSLLLDENSQYIELWYECGVVFTNLALEDLKEKDEYEDAAAQYLLTAQELLTQDFDEDLSKNIAEQLEYLEKRGVNIELSRSRMQENALYDSDFEDVDNNTMRP